MKDTIYPGAVWLPADPSNFRHSARSTYGQIVIHCTDGRPDPYAVARMWQSPHHGSSAHFVIGQDGTVIQSVSLFDIAWHAHAANGSSVGIEHCARTPREFGPTDPGLPPTAPQLLASARLTKWLCENVGLVPSRAVIRGHAEADPKSTHRLCPTGCGLNLDAYFCIVAALGETH